MNDFDSRDPRWDKDEQHPQCEWCLDHKEGCREFCRIDAKNIHPVSFRVQAACGSCIDRYSLDEQLCEINELKNV